MAAQTTTIRVTIKDDGHGGIGKSITPPEPHSRKYGEFRWRIRNDLGKDIAVNLTSFDPEGYVYIDPETLPLCLKSKKAGEVTGAVENDEGPRKKITYKITVDDKPIDPDLIIDGDPGGGREPKGPKKARGGKTKGGKKR